MKMYSAPDLVRTYIQVYHWGPNPGNSPLHTAILRFKLSQTWIN